MKVGSSFFSEKTIRMMMIVGITLLLIGIAGILAFALYTLYSLDESIDEVKKENKKHHDALEVFNRHDLTEKTKIARTNLNMNMLEQRIQEYDADIMSSLDDLENDIRSLQHKIDKYKHTSNFMDMTQLALDTNALMLVSREIEIIKNKTDTFSELVNSYDFKKLKDVVASLKTVPPIIEELDRKVSKINAGIVSNVNVVELQRAYNDNVNRLLDKLRDVEDIIKVIKKSHANDVPDLQKKYSAIEQKLKHCDDTTATINSKYQTVNGKNSALGRDIASATVALSGVESTLNKINSVAAKISNVTINYDHDISYVKTELGKADARVEEYLKKNDLASLAKTCTSQIELDSLLVPASTINRYTGNMVTKDKMQQICGKVALKSDVDKMISNFKSDVKKHTDAQATVAADINLANKDIRSYDVVNIADKLCIDDQCLTSKDIQHLFKAFK